LDGLRQYSFIDATYQFNGTIASPNNPMADANGNIFVTPGNKIPASPAHQLKLVERSRKRCLKVGVDARWAYQYFHADDSNLNEKVPAYWTTNLFTRPIRLRKIADLRIITNLFNQRYYTYGTYFQL